MSGFPYRTALIVGAGPGIGASLARQLIAQGVRVALGARDIARLRPLAADIGALAFEADAADPASVANLFACAEWANGPADVVVYNAASRPARAFILALDPRQVGADLAASAYGGFLVVQQAALRMAPARHGCILLSGATASVKGFADSAPFAMGKFALRGLAQSAARELGPQGIHVAHIVIDGLVRSATRTDPPAQPDSTLDPEAIARSYLAVMRQERCAWSHEIDLRPWVEPF